jgi:hypothetical protein
MTLLTILASTAADDEPTFLSCAGPVDWPTAAAEEVVLWDDLYIVRRQPGRERTL